MHPVLVKLGEHSIGTLHFGNSPEVPSLQSIQDKYHAGVEGLLAHGPADKRCWDPNVEEEEGSKQIFR
jgi:hypothetical protein